VKRSVHPRPAHIRAVVIVALSLAIVLPFIPSTARANPGTIYVPAEFATIQGAVNASSPGDRIIVAQGTYNESVVVEKSLTLLGQSSGTTIIDARSRGPGINITGTSAVTISGFTIRDTDFLDSGILVASSTNVTIENNIVEASTQSNGTYLVDSNNVIIKANNFTGNLWGINIQGGFGNLIQDNNSTRNSIGVGIFASTGNKIVDNEFRYEQTGVDVNYGSTGNILARNDISNDTFGIRIQSSSINLIRENNIDFNNQQASSVGVYLNGARANLIYYNNIRSNSIQMAGSSAGDVTGNTWNDGAAKPHGNYWSDYTGIDSDMDGVGDTLTPWPCPTGGSPCSYFGPPGVDSYPLMSPRKPSALPVTALGFLASSCPGTTGLQVRFSGSVGGAPAPYIYDWNFGDGSTGTGQETSHTYTAHGAFFATLTATNSTANTNGTDLVPVTVFSGSVQLHVTDQDSKPLGQANVTSLVQPPGEAGFRIFTDSQGLGTVACLAPGGYRVEISRAGYNSQTIAFSIADATLNVSVALVNINPLPPRNGSLYWVIYGVVGVGVATGLGVYYFYRSRRRSPPKR